eukprot:m.54353 g.54353  ORF g.54353 m.54353 type:complete len:395 (-) comp12455_c1_seq2:127-1311(-)
MAKRMDLGPDSAPKKAYDYDATMTKQRVAQRLREGPNLKAASGSGAMAAPASKFASKSPAATSTTPLGFEWQDEGSASLHAAFMQRYMSILTTRAMEWSKAFPEPSRARKSRKLRQMIRLGIPHNDRPAVWMSVSGAAARRSKHPGHYTTMLKQAEKGPTDHTSQIDLDLERTFPDNRRFRDPSPQGCLAKLRNVLYAYSVHNKEMGYCQGMNYVVGLMLLVLEDEEAAFWLLDVAMDDIVPAYYLPHMVALKVDNDVLLDFMNDRLPALAAHCEALGVPLGTVTTKWFLNWYIDVMPPDTVLRIWDCLFLEGSKILFRVALASLELNQDKILSLRDDFDVLEFVKNMGRSCHDCERLMETAFSYKHLRRKHMKKRRSFHSDALAEAKRESSQQ